MHADVEKFVARLPDGMRSRLAERADREYTSMNSIMVKALEQYLDGQERQNALLDALAAANKSRKECSKCQ